MDFAYSTKYATNIRTVVADTCSGDMRDFLTYLMMDNAEFDSFVKREIKSNAEIFISAGIKME
jgi:hypothetical protein